MATVLPMPPRNTPDLAEIARRIAAVKGGKPRKSGDQYLCRCPMPAHEDRNPSFSVGFDPEKGVLVHCHAGCDQRAVLQHLLDLGILPKRRALPERRSHTQPSAVARGHPFSTGTAPPAGIPRQISGMEYAGHWLYHDPQGKPIGYAVRYDSAKGKKKFSYFFTPSSRAGVFLAAIPEPYKSQPRHLYGAHKLSLAKKEDPVWVVEGEGCAECAASLGALATTSMGGAQASARSDWSPLRDRDVILWPDADTPGTLYVDQVANTLLGLPVRSMRIVDIAGLWARPEGQDIVDWAECGNADLSQVPLLPYDASTARRLQEYCRVSLSGSTAGNGENGAGNQVSVNKNPAGGNPSGGTPSSPSGTSVSHIQTVIHYPDVRKDGSLLPTFASAVYHAQNMVLQYNRFADCILIDGLPLEEAHIREITLAFNRQFDTKFTIPTIQDAIITVAQRHAIHPVQEKLRSLRWDGVPRLGTLIRDVFHLPQTPYHEAVGRNFFTMAAQRILEPGVKADVMLLLYGAQGPGKSRFVREMAYNDASWYAEIWDNPGNKDFYMNLQGHWIIELSELDAFRHAAETSIKRFLSAQHDTYRPAYARETRTFPRQCVFVGTTNDPTPLHEMNGNRRYWPVLANTVDLDLFRTYRNDYWAEAVHLAQSGHRFWEMPEEETVEVQETYRSAHPWEARIGKWLSGDMDALYYPDEVGRPPAYATTDLILEHCIQKLTGMWQRRDHMDIGNILRHLGWSRTQVRVGTGREYRYYKNPNPQQEKSP